MLCDSSKQKNIRAIYNRDLFRISRTGKHLNRFIPKQTLAYCLPEAIFGQELPLRIWPLSSTFDTMQALR